ncbi:MAG: ATP synthase subunit I [Proteobacteria bacterium]|nr:ATP synthase subunit I [Desulfobacteraceae bacterium]MBU2522605.1 ATP synthase subunit I [Pseudomonadota bacterium]MBU4014078.1 ATP synthase subunit I [Pseudomonadota bacterium]MBU4069207.1 ATP synthase subunit I [Pseudomonadota bacterium]MBU4101112.1 ATP synthase subunit I [Pseudomonadota bacterium]
MAVTSLLLSFTAGIGLGTFYFGGLWLTVRRLPTARNPALLSLGSFFGRLVLVLACFYFVMDGHWQRLMVCMLGFLGMRSILVRLWGPDRGKLKATSE